MDPILILLLSLCRQNSKKVGGQTPPEIKVRGLGPCGVPGSTTYDYNYANGFLCIVFCLGIWKLGN